ncbi:MAG: hypothetical protein KKA31_05070 [Candidatus Margulisbacteria bacterium]|nr:hypothetical protein [Candidatus Margulisiibacteriota bacterium]
MSADKIGSTKKYTVADVYREASSLLKNEMQGIKNKPLSKTEEVKMEKLAKLLSNNVLKEMNIV